MTEHRVKALSVHNENDLRKIEALRDEIEALRAASGWMPIETAPSGKVLLYFPERQDANGRNKLSAWMKIDFATHSHRQPTHWMPLPEAPTSPLSDAHQPNPASETAKTAPN